jgi:threonine dehydrogenase-like Zn-dependent dehydrogenase
MRALTWQGNLDVQVTDVPDPRIEKPNDAIIQVTSTAICGSDLHLYGVLGPYLSPGDVLGHEAMSIVQEVGRDPGPGGDGGHRRTADRDDRRTRA